MKIINDRNNPIHQILEKLNREGNTGCLLKYCVKIPVTEGVLLFNLLTRELVLLNEEEWQKCFENEYMKKHWFVVPEDCKDKEFADLVRWVLGNKQKKSKNITGYTIFPTTDCNARCFYCFELS